MDRYFFDLDDVPDRCGITMPSAEQACAEAVNSMPEYVAEMMTKGARAPQMTCVIRKSDSSTLFKIVASMRVEDASGDTVDPPFTLAPIAAKQTR